MTRWPRVGDVYVDPCGTHWRLVNKLPDGNCIIFAVKGKTPLRRIHYLKLKLGSWYTLVGVGFRKKVKRGAT